MTDENKTTPDVEAKKKRLRRIALAVGILLAIVCKSLPPEYQVVCDTIAQVCRGGI